MPRTLSAAWLLLAAVLLISCGKIELPKNGPGDPDITYENVYADPDGYVAKRVAWKAAGVMQMRGPPKGAPEPNPITTVLFGDLKNYARNEDPASLRAFVVEYPCALDELASSNTLEGRTITATVAGATTVFVVEEPQYIIAGTQISVTLTSPPGSRSGSRMRTSLKVPLLKHPESNPE